MTKLSWSRAVVAASLILASSTVGAAVQQPAASQVQALIERIAATIKLVPASSTVGSYQAQIASTIDAAGVPCEVVQRALASPASGSPEPAQRALQRLRVVFQRCASGGTGAVGGGNTATAGAPGFSVGGGSVNYIR